MEQWIKTTAQLHGEKRLSVWFEDEARFGQQGTTTRIWALRGTKPDVFKQMDFEWLYVFGSVCPATGRCHSCLISQADTVAMNGYLENFSRHLAQDEHALLVLDRAGWHRSGALKIPENVTLLLLPPYSPQLNPIELLWRQMRGRRLSNTVFETVWQMDCAVADAWLYITQDVSSIKSLCFFPWIESAVNTLN